MSALGGELGRALGTRQWAARRLVDLVRAIPRLFASPIVSIELAASFRRMRFLVAFTIALLVIVGILIAIVAANVQERPARIGQYIFLGFSITLGFVIGVLFPAFACASIVEERVNRSLDLLLVTKLEPWEIFTGKLSGALVYCAMYLAGTLPVVGLSFIFGGVEPTAILVAYAAALALSLLICTVGTYASATAGTFIRAIVTSYLLSWLMAGIFGGALVPILGYWVAPGWGLSSGRSESEFESWFQNAGDLTYAGAAFIFVSIVAFFGIAGANRLKPASYDRSTAMRAFALLWFGAGLLLDAAGARRVLSTGTGTIGNDFASAAVTRLCIIAGLLFIAVLIFSTERTDLSRRVKLELAARFRLSPMRLLAPGPARGALFAILLVAGALLGHAHEAAWGTGLAHASDKLDRGDLTLRDLALVLASFLVFLACFGRLLAEHASGTVAPRLAVAGLAVVLTLAPILVLIAHMDAPIDPVTNQPIDEGGVPAVTRGYVLSPILAGISAVTLPPVNERPTYFLHPGAFATRPEAYATARGELYSASPLAAEEAAAIPLHRASAVLYFGLAAILWFWAAVRARQREREERSREAAAKAPAPAPPVPAEPARAVATETPT